MRDLHVHNYAQKSSWMDSTIFTKWYQKLFLNVAKHSMKKGLHQESWTLAS